MPQSDEFAGPAERSLHDQLELVRAHPPRSASALDVRVERTLRWQAIVAVPLTAVAAFAGGLVAGLRLFGRPGTR